MRYLTCLILFACDVPRASDSMTRPTARKAPMVERMLAQNPASVSALDWRDPFGPITAPVTLQPVHPGTYQVVGIVWGLDAPQALVEDGLGRSYLVQEGELLGESWGHIDRISADGIDVTTAYVTITGDAVRETITLQLPGQ